MHMNKIKTKKGEWFIQKKSAHLPEKESAMSLQIYICPVFILLEVGWNYVQPVFILLEVGWKDIQTNIIVHYKGTVSVEKCKNIIDTSDGDSWPSIENKFLPNFFTRHLWFYVVDIMKLLLCICFPLLFSFAAPAFQISSIISEEILKAVLWSFSFWWNPHYWIRTFI